MCVCVCVTVCVCVCEEIGTPFPMFVCSGCVYVCAVISEMSIVAQSIFVSMMIKIIFYSFRAASRKWI